MAEQKQQSYPAHLYDANGNHVADVEHDVDLMAPSERTAVVEVGGKLYGWDQRNGQWRESSATHKVSKGDVEAVKAESAPAPSSAAKP